MSLSLSCLCLVLVALLRQRQEIGRCASILKVCSYFVFEVFSWNLLESLSFVFMSLFCSSVSLRLCFCRLYSRFVYVFDFRLFGLSLSLCLVWPCFRICFCVFCCLRLRLFLPCLCLCLVFFLVFPFLLVFVLVFVFVFFPVFAFVFVFGFAFVVGSLSLFALPLALSLPSPGSCLPNEFVQELITNRKAIFKGE